MLPHSDDLRYFLCVSECKNISRAAELLGISQPSLSLAIKRLEAIVGMNLFVRTNAGVDLTRAGNAFAARSKELLVLWHAISEDVRKDADEVTGRYVLGAHVSVVLTHLISVVKELMMLHTDLEIAMEHGLSRIITDQVISFDIDFAVVVNPVLHPDLVIKEFCQDVVGFFVSNDGFDHEVLIYDPNLLQAQSLLREMKRLGLKFRRTITSASLEVIANLGVQGAGIALLPERAARGAVNLRRFQDQLPLFYDRHCLIYRADAQKTKSSRKLVQDLLRLLVARTQMQI